jgi:tetratricopeptide (TPR) repeat protein
MSLFVSRTITSRLSEKTTVVFDFDSISSMKLSRGHKHIEIINTSFSVFAREPSASGYLPHIASLRSADGTHTSLDPLLLDTVPSSSLTHHTESEDTSLANMNVHYESPLLVFRAYRLSPNYPLPWTSATHSSRIEPHAILCKYDLHGTCNDDECPALHARDYHLSEREILRDLLRYVEAIVHSELSSSPSYVSEILHSIERDLSSSSFTSAQMNFRIEQLRTLVGELLQSALSQSPRQVSDVPAHYIVFRKGGPKSSYRSTRDREKTPAKNKSRSSLKTNSNVQPTTRVREVGEVTNSVPVNDGDSWPQQDFLPLSASTEYSESGYHDDTKEEIRYFNVPPTRAEFEQLVAQQPHNIDLWLRYVLKITEGALENREIVYTAYDENEALEADTTRDFSQWIINQLNTLHQWLQTSHLNGEFDHDELTHLTESEHSTLQHLVTHLLTNSDSSVPNRVLALHLLSTALESNCKSTALWTAYLRMFVPYAQYRADMLTLLHQALDFTNNATVPSAHSLWDIYLEFEYSNVERRIQVCEDALTLLTANPQSEANSLAVLRVVWAMCATYDAAGHKEPARSQLHSVLFQSKTLSYFQQPASSVFVPSHFVLLTIIYLHYLCFDRLPPDETLKYALPNGEPFVLNWELITEQYNASNTNNNNTRQRTIPTLQTLRDFFEDTLKLFATLSIPPSAQISVMLNYILMEQTLGQIDKARVLCQRFLTQDAALIDVWVAYANLERMNGNYVVANLIYEKSLSKFQHSFQLWYHYAFLKLHTTNDIDAVLQILADSVLQFIASDERTPMKVSRADERSIATVRSLFRRVLGISTKITSLESFAPEYLSKYTGPLKISQDVEKKLPQDVYLWLIFCFFSALVDRDFVTNEIFEEALKILIDPLSKSKVWVQYVEWKIAIGANTNSLLNTVNAFLRNFNPVMGSLVQLARAELQVENLSSFTLDAFRPPLPRLTSVSNFVVQRLLSTLSDEQRQRLLSQIIFSISSDNIDLIVSVVESLISKETSSLFELTLAKSLLLTTLRTNPHSILYWVMLVQTELKLKGPQAAVSCVEKALEFHPISSALWILLFVLNIFIVFQQTVVNRSTTRATTTGTTTIATTTTTQENGNDSNLDQIFSTFFERVRKSGVLLVDIV